MVCFMYCYFLLSINMYFENWRGKSLASWRGSNRKRIKVGSIQSKGWPVRGGASPCRPAEAWTVYMTVKLGILGRISCVPFSYLLIKYQPESNLSHTLSVPLSIVKETIKWRTKYTFPKDELIAAGFLDPDSHFTLPIQGLSPASFNSVLSAKWFSSLYKYVVVLSVFKSVYV